ncbi:MAG: amidase [Chloroflexi bacterium]|nr:amidase [Chloroflexota bacterium]
MPENDLHYLTISEASSHIKSGRLSPVELVNAHLERIEQTDDRLNSFVTLLADQAKAAAATAEAEIRSGNYRGVLHGIPIGLKDLYYTEGIRTTVGSKIMGDFVPDYDAAVTERFADAGAILLGKLQMHEFALGATSENPHQGPAHNPWDTSRITGGSSGGSGSAVASGQCMAALGSDTGGSVRIPASACGIVGHKPTFGRISRVGVFPLSNSLDTVGPMTRSVTDAAIVMNAIAGYDERDQSCANRPDEDFTRLLGKDIAGLRIGIPQEYFYEMIDEEVRVAVLQAASKLEELGARVEECSIPVLNDSISISGTILLTEAAEIHLDNLRERADDFGADVRGRLEEGAMNPAVTYIAAQRARTEFNRAIAESMKTYDILLAPTTAAPAPKIGEDIVEVGGQTEHKLALMPRLTRPHNICGIPTVSVPCGFSSDGLPIGMQLAARPFEDALALQVAYAYEQATDWHTRRPPV